MHNQNNQNNTHVDPNRKPTATNVDSKHKTSTSDIDPNLNAHSALAHGNWLINLVKGVFVGIGAILPGLSGGVLAMIFGIYDPLIAFLSNLKKDFKKNVLYFTPVILGIGIGVLLFSIVVEKAFGRYAALFTCLFIGFVVGTLPLLYKKAGSQGRTQKDNLLLVGSAVVIFGLMMIGDALPDIQPGLVAWIVSGFLVALGFIVPGMSPSNFLIYFGLYNKMSRGIRTFDFSVLIPLGIGFLLCVLLFSKLVANLFKTRFSPMSHFIVGMVVGSSAAIFPTTVFPAFTESGLQEMGLTFATALLISVVMFVIGVFLSFLFSKVEEKYDRD